MKVVKKHDKDPGKGTGKSRGFKGQNIEKDKNRKYLDLHLTFDPLYA